MNARARPSKAPMLRVALAQYSAGADIENICSEACKLGAEILVFPEMYSNGYAKFDRTSQSMRQTWLDGAVDLESAYVNRFRQAALHYGIAIVTTFLEKGVDKPFNSAVLIDATGTCVLHQRKRHICFFDNPEEVCGAGDTSSVFRLNTATRSVTIGIVICMDREYSDVSSDLVAKGAELLLIPNSCQLIDDDVVGDVRVAGVRAMAFQNCLGIAVANYPSPKDDGHSFAVDALGRIIHMADTTPKLVTVDFDLDALANIRAKEWFRRTPGRTVQKATDSH